MDGLEAVELRLSEVFIENYSFRFDSEYFKKKYLKEDIYRKKFKNYFLEEIAFITDGQHGYHEVDFNSNISHITAKNTRNWFTDNINSDRLAKWVDDKNKRSSLEIDDILFSTRGTVGQCSIVTKEILPANIDQDLVRINILNDEINPFYLLVYMNSKFGKDWAIRNSSGMVQQGIPILRMKRFQLPLLNKKFQFKIEKLLKLSYQKLEDSKTLYKQSEKLLLKELDLLDFEPLNIEVNEKYSFNKKGISIKSFSESFGDSGRLDSEYYQPKYDEVIEKIKNYNGGYVKLSDIAITKRGSLIPNNYYGKNGKPYIRGADISSNILNNKKLTYIDNKFKTKNETIVYENDILFALIGSVGTASLVIKDFDNSFLSNNLGLIRLTKQNIKPIVLHLILTSKQIGSMYFEQKEMRTAQPKISDKDIHDFIIPIINNTIQTQIEEKVKEFFKLKEESKELLELAKKAVEVAIEEGEEVAMKLIEKEKI